MSSINNSAITPFVYTPIQKVEESSACPFQRVPHEITQWIFSLGVFSPADFSAVCKVCKYFKQIVELMKKDDSLGTALFRNVFPGVTPKKAQKPKASTTLDQFINIFKKYQSLKQEIREEEKRTRSGILLLRGMTGDDGLIGQIRTGRLWLENNSQDMANEIGKFNFSSKIDQDLLVQLLKSTLDTLYLIPLGREKLRLAGPKFDGQDSTISSVSQLGVILAAKKAVSDPQLIDVFSKKEKFIRDRLHILQGILQFCNDQFANVCSILRDGVYNFNSFAIQLAEIASQFDELDKELEQTAGSEFDGSDQSLSKDSSLYNTLQKPERLKAAFANFSQEDYVKFLKGDALFDGALR
jgi:hypothetical protein